MFISRFDRSRFRFRFNGVDQGRHQYRKRMPEVIPEDNPNDVIKEAEEDPVVEDVEAYSFADEYWKEYLNEVARKKVMQSLVSWKMGEDF